MRGNTEIVMDLPLDCVHVHTHCGDFATAVLMKFVATCLTSEAIKKKLVTKITVGQLEEGFPYLQKRVHMYGNRKYNYISITQTKSNQNIYTYTYTHTWLQSG